MGLIYVNMQHDYSRMLTCLFRMLTYSVIMYRRNGVRYRAFASHAGDRGSIPGRDRPEL